MEGSVPLPPDASEEADGKVKMEDEESPLTFVPSYLSEDGITLYAWANDPNPDPEEALKLAIRANFLAILGVSYHAVKLIPNISTIPLADVGCHVEYKANEVAWEKLRDILINARLSLVRWPEGCHMPYENKSVKSKRTFSGVSFKERQVLMAAMIKDPPQALRAVPWPAGECNKVE